MNLSKTLTGILIGMLVLQVANIAFDVIARQEASNQSLFNRQLNEEMLRKVQENREQIDELRQTR